MLKVDLGLLMFLRIWSLDDLSNLWKVNLFSALKVDLLSSGCIILLDYIHLELKGGSLLKRVEGEILFHSTHFSEMAMEVIQASEEICWVLMKLMGLKNSLKFIVGICLFEDIPRSENVDCCCTSGGTFFGLSLEVPDSVMLSLSRRSASVVCWKVNLTKPKGLKSYSLQELATFSPESRLEGPSFVTQKDKVEVVKGDLGFTKLIKGVAICPGFVILGEVNLARKAFQVFDIMTKKNVSTELSKEKRKSPTKQKSWALSVNFVDVKFNLTILMHRRVGTGYDNCAQLFKDVEASVRMWALQGFSRVLVAKKLRRTTKGFCSGFLMPIVEDGDANGLVLVDMEFFLDNSNSKDVFFPGIDLSKFFRCYDAAFSVVMILCHSERLILDGSLLNRELMASVKVIGNIVQKRMGRIDPVKAYVCEAIIRLGTRSLRLSVSLNGDLFQQDARIIDAQRTGDMQVSFSLVMEKGVLFVESRGASIPVRNIALKMRFGGKKEKGAYEALSVSNEHHCFTIFRINLKGLLMEVAKVAEVDQSNENLDRLVTVGTAQKDYLRKVCNLQNLIPGIVIFFWTNQGVYPLFVS